MFDTGSGNTVIKSKLISRRMFLLTISKAVVVVGVLGRLISLQINESSKYKTLSDKNRFREWKLAPERGVIKDYFNNEIASNKQVYQIHLIPENTQSIEETFFRLKTILNISDKKIFSLKKKIAKQKPWEPIIISDNLNSTLLILFISSPLNLIDIFIFISFLSKTQILKSTFS